MWTGTKTLISVAVVVAAALATAMGPTPLDAQDSIFVDRGACPGESCRYGVWRVLEDVALRAVPADTALAADSIAAGRLVCALDGEVHTVHGQFVVHSAHDRYAPGDTILVYTYQGEGRFSVEYDGQRYVEDLQFSPFGATGSRCEEDPRCWGRLLEPLDFTWWVRIDDLQGTQGWGVGTFGFSPWVTEVEAPEFFDACARRRSDHQ